jgi:cytochrome c oxidase cbb3-type subunit III
MNKPGTKLRLLALLVMASSLPAAAQGDLIRDTFNDTYFWLVAMGVVFLLFALYAVNHAFNTITKQFQPKTEDAAAPVARPSGLMQALTDATPVEKEADILLDHDYDGIKELDNNLPPWWKWGFYISIVYAVVYLFLAHVVKVVPMSDQEYENEMAAAEVALENYRATATNLVDETNVFVVEEEGRLMNGKKLFDANCVACHAADGGGIVGPNLTDEYWIHGGSIKDVFSVIKNGVIEKGMIPWKTQMKPAEMQDVASYVLSLVGTTPANPKAAEGEKYTPEAAAPSNEEAATDEVVQADANTEEQES